MPAPERKVHRLTDMLVEEVSLVDRAANKRKFLVVKRDTEKKGLDDMAAGAEVTSDGKGGLTASGDTSKGTPPAGGGAPAKEDDKKKPPMAKAALELPPGIKEMMAPLLEKASERLSALSDLVSGASAAAIGDNGEMPACPPEVMQGIESVGALLAQCAKLCQLAGTAPAEGAEGEGAEGAEGEEVPEEMAMAAKAIVAKVGAKMSKERLDRFSQALNVLGSIFTELRGAGAEGAAGGAPAPAGKGAPAKKADEKPDAVADLAKSVERLASAVKKTNEKVDTISKTRGGGNALQVEGAPQRAEPADVSWPLDMNSPVTRESVNKAESFFDD